MISRGKEKSSSRSLSRSRSRSPRHRKEPEVKYVMMELFIYTCVNFVCIVVLVMAAGDSASLMSLYLVCLFCGVLKTFCQSLEDK